MSKNTIDTLVQRTIKNKTYELGFKVQLIPEQDFNVQAFIKRAIHICDLQVSAQDTQLFLNGFIIPKKSSAFTIKSCNTYILKIIEDSEEKLNKRKSKSIKKFLKWAHLKQEIQKQQEHQIINEQPNSQSEQSNNQQTPVVQIKKKTNKAKNSRSKVSKNVTHQENRAAKPQQKQKKPQKSIQNSSPSEQIQSEPQSQPQSLSQPLSQSLPKAKAKPKPKSKPQSQSSSQQSSLSSSSQSSDLQNLRGLITKKKHQTRQNPIVSNKNKEVTAEIKRSLNQEINQPTQVYKNVIRTLQPAINISKPKKSINQPSLFETMKTSNSSHLNSGVKLRQIINGSSESQQPLQQKRTQSIKKSIATVRPTLIPSSVKRNNQSRIGSFDKKPNNPSFKDHKQNQWIPLTEKLIKEYAEKNQGQYVIQSKNQIRFKTIQLDEQKFTPVFSDWIEGVVVSANAQQIKLQRAKKGTNYLGQYTIAFHNMTEPSINRLYLQQKQKGLIGQQLRQSKPKQLDQKISLNKQQNDRQQYTKNESNNNLGQSVQDFVCGQINYYFSDKNYSGDLFMQMHANRHPQKYIELGFMLNFPKIKKTMIDKFKLMQFLKQDHRKNKRNYQLDEERGLIRKKGIKIEPQGKTQKQQLEGQHKQDNAEIV